MPVGEKFYVAMIYIGDIKHDFGENGIRSQFTQVSVLGEFMFPRDLF